jgi:Ulp1 protease family, C-terminal catalytic domain
MHRARDDTEICRRRYLDTIGLRRILPNILIVSSFYESRPELKCLRREWDIRFANPEHCFDQNENHSCGPFSLKTIEVLVSRRGLVNVDEDHMAEIRKRIAERIYSFSLMNVHQ